MTSAPEYAKPYFWWGPGWQRSPPRSLPELVAGGTLSLATAALLATAVQDHWSIAVLAGPSGVGKTTLLTALLPFVSAGNQQIYVRGAFEPFAFLTDSTVAAGSTTLLCNEISPHLPVYLWGTGVATFLAARARGFQVLATAHAADGLAFVRLLTGPPLRIAGHLVGGWDLVVGLEAAVAEKGGGPKIAGLWAFRPAAADGIVLNHLGDGHGALPDLLPNLAAIEPPRGLEPLTRERVEATIVRLAAAGQPPDEGRIALESKEAPRPQPEPAPWRPRRSRPNG